MMITSRKNTFKKRYFDSNPAVSELFSMKYVYIFANIAVLACCAVYCAFNGFYWQLFTGLLLGNIISVLNFWLIGVTALKTLSGKGEKRAKFFANASYGARYIGIFAVLAVALLFNVVNIITAMVPLFFIKIYYTMKLFKKEEF